MIQIALFGAGVIGAVHAENVAANPDSTLAYVVDPQLARAQSLAAKYGAAALPQAEAALSDPDLDAVIIGSSTSAHEDQLLASIAAGKACLCEKPLADSLEAAVRCLKAAQSAGVIAAVGFNRRLDRQYREVFERVRAGELGQVEMLHVASRGNRAPAPETAPLSGGMLREKGTHFYDLVCWIANRDPVEVYTAGACRIDPGYAAYDDVDTAALTLRLTDDTLATFDFGRRTAFGQDELIEVFGAEGMLISGRQRDGDVCLYAGKNTVGPGIHYSWHDRFADSYIEELTRFVRAVKGDEAVHATLADAVRAQAVAEAAVISHRENRPVRIEPIW
ncbi:MAG: Gfo/Idh/MocA family oxidoreductase [Gammaproteobacteria bacterium]|nr:Gfo/Idh/MocA family oxidoreductase [Gammaproteobacteria bacterium]